MLAKKLVFLILMAQFRPPTFAQDHRFWLSGLIGKADTVWLVSHKDLPLQHLPVEDRLLVHGRLNPDLVLAQKMLVRSGLDSLTAILTTTIEYDRIEETLCFDPHRAIAWSKKGKLSYIECCFHCLRFVASSDLTALQGKNFGYRKWAMLHDFFERRGVMSDIPDTH